MDQEVGFNSTWSKYWNSLYSDIKSEEEFPSVRPLLAHYTSLENIENILRSEEMWLSNPLLMNDSEEVRFGVLNGLEIISSNASLREALRTDYRRKLFFDAIDADYQLYGNEHVIDLYLICFSRHVDDDGLLSMWRGYGNQGKGAALVFDTSKLPAPENSPLVLGPVSYASQEERKAKILAKVEEVAAFIASSHIPDEYISATASALFGRLYLFSIFSKHQGFKEENEWRLVYFKDRDGPEDDGSRLKFEKYFGYAYGVSGIQPKLKLPVGEFLRAMGADVSFSDLIHSVIVGPSVSSPISKRAVQRMLRVINKCELIDKVKTSGIPFRG